MKIIGMQGGESRTRIAVLFDPLSRGRMGGDLFEGLAGRRPYRIADVFLFTTAFDQARTV
uniref:hypothetical protein n=1 Tax=Candidatus Regiella insecticola TaxID=138073 RepID=UPI001F36C755|nr:hypothetical protein [Candidatus Regiella insecticola]